MMKALRGWLECRFARGAMGAYLDGEAPHLRARVEAHLGACPRCRELAEALSAQARAIETLPAEEEPPAGFVNRVMQRISETEAARVSARPAWRLVTVTAAAAAVAAIAVALWPILARAPSPAQPPAAGGKIAKGGASAHVAVLPTPAPTSPQQEYAPPDLKQAERGARHAPRVPGPIAMRKAQPPSVEKPGVAQAHRDAGRSYENQGELDEALNEYAAARDEGGSQLARLDVARVYEKTGHTAEALDELVAVAFAELDEDEWEPLTVD
jgi:hypothetical protein